jgi:DNA ligase D-like protein (predicted 3'-phosphoesterase)
VTDRLHTYRAKRRASATTEPGLGDDAAAPPPTRRRAKPRFVIQKHQARNLHYDLRLEVDGTLRSWAVPKGPSTDPREKRLAVEVEDHPLEYADFEGVIDRGNYGAGAVIVWDAGTYRNLDEQRTMAEALEAGHAKFWLEGRKLRGGWTLQRTSRGGGQAGGGAKPQWLLIKRRDEQADARRNPEGTEPQSVKSGRTIEQVVREEQGDPE